MCLPLLQLLVALFLVKPELLRQLLPPVCDNRHLLESLRGQVTPVLPLCVPDCDQK